MCERCGKPLQNAPSAIPIQAPTANPRRPVSSAAPSAPATSGARKKQGRAPEANGLCRLCGAVTSLRAACRNCGAPLGLIANPGDSTGATFLPPGMLYPPPMDALQAVPERAVPSALARLRWNWGACGASLLWLMGHRLVGWALLMLLLNIASLTAFSGPLYLLIPYSGALLSLVLGAQGHYLAWQKQTGMDELRFLQTETRWKWIGLVGLPIKLGLLAFLTWTAYRQG